MLIGGPINGFRLSSRRCSCPPSSRATSSSTTIPSHTRGKAVRHAVNEAGAKLFFLPKCSPDLNPIEMLLPNSCTC
ncbi:transposase [Mesorhizobium sp. M0622]